MSGETTLLPLAGPGASALPSPVFDALRDGWLLDVVIAGVVVEAAVLLWWHRCSGRGLGAAALLPNLLAGVCLMLALRSVLAQADVRWTALALLAAGLAHLMDLRQRWPRR